MASKFRVSSSDLDNMSNDELKAYSQGFNKVWNSKLRNTEEARASGEEALGAFRNQKLSVLQPQKPTLSPLNDPAKSSFSIRQWFNTGSPFVSANQPTTQQAQWAKDYSNYQLPNGLTDRLSERSGMDISQTQDPMQFAEYIAKYHPEFSSTYGTAFKQAMADNGGDAQAALKTVQESFSGMIDSKREEGQYANLQNNAAAAIHQAIGYENYMKLPEDARRSILDAYDEAGMITFGDEQPDYVTAIREAYDKVKPFTFAPAPEQTLGTGNVDAQIKALDEQIDELNTEYNRWDTTEERAHELDTQIQELMNQRDELEGQKNSERRDTASIFDDQYMVNLYKEQGYYPEYDNSIRAYQQAIDELTAEGGNEQLVAEYKAKVAELEAQKQAAVNEWQNSPEREEFLPLMERTEAERESISRIPGNTAEVVRQAGAAGLDLATNAAVGALGYLNRKTEGIRQFFYDNLTPESMKTPTMEYLVHGDDYSFLRNKLNKDYNDRETKINDRIQAVEDDVVNIAKQHWTELGWKEFGNEEQLREATRFVMENFFEATGMQIGQQAPILAASVFFAGAEGVGNILSHPEYWLTFVSDFCANLTERYDEAKAGGKELTDLDVLFLAGGSLVNAYVEHGMGADEAYRHGLTSMVGSIFGEIKEEVVQDKVEQLRDLFADLVQHRDSNVYLYSNDKDTRALVNLSADWETAWKTALTTLGMDISHAATFGIVQRMANHEQISAAEKQQVIDVLDAMMGQDPGTQFEQAANGEETATSTDKTMPEDETVETLPEFTGENQLPGTTKTGRHEPINDQTISPEVQQKYAELDDDTLQALIVNTEDNLSKAEEGTTYYQAQEQILNEARAVMENRRNGTTKTGRPEPTNEGTDNPSNIPAEPEIPTLEIYSAIAAKYRGDNELVDPRLQGKNLAELQAMLQERRPAQEAPESQLPQPMRTEARETPTDEGTNNPNNIPAEAVETVRGRVEQQYEPPVPKPEREAAPAQQDQQTIDEPRTAENEEGQTAENASEQEAQRNLELESTGDTQRYEQKEVPQPPQNVVPVPNQTDTQAVREAEVKEPEAPETTPTEQAVEVQSQEGLAEEKQVDEGEPPAAPVNTTDEIEEPEVPKASVNQEVDEQTQKTASTWGFKSGSTIGDGRGDTGVHLANGVGGMLSNSRLRELSVIDKVAKRFGFSVEVVPSIEHGANGVYRGGRTVYINANTQNALETVAGHEMWHMVKHLSPKSAEQIEAIFNKWGKRTGFDIETAIADRIDEYAENGVKLSHDEAYEEVIANSFYSFFNDENTMRAVYVADKNLFTRVMDFVKKVQQSVREMLGNYEESTPEARMLAEQDGALDAMYGKMRKVLEEMRKLDDTKKTATKAKANGEMTRRYESAVYNSTTNGGVTDAAIALAKETLRKTGNPVNAKNISRIVRAAQNVANGSQQPYYAMKQVGLSVDGMDPEARRALMNLGAYAESLKNAGAAYQELLSGERELTAEEKAEVNETGKSGPDSAIDKVSERTGENADLLTKVSEKAQDTQGKKVFSLKSMKHDYDIYKKMMRDSKQFSEDEIRNLFNVIDKTVAAVKMNPMILDLNERENKDERAFSPVKPNSDALYKVSLDFSTLCRKRLLQQTVQEIIENKYNTVMSKGERVALRNALQEVQKEGKKIEIACALCYVESARLKSPKQIQRFMDDKRRFIVDYMSKTDKNYKEAIQQAADAKAAELGYEEGYSLKAMPKKDADAIRAVKRRMSAEYTPSAEQEAMIREAETMDESMYKTADGLAKLKKNYPIIFNAYTSMVRNATNSKGLESDVPYYAGDTYGTISDGLIESMNAENGLRSQSWSDFQVAHILDYMGAIIELSTRNAKMHVYTKVPEYVRLMGKTGQMIDMSLIPMDYDGEHLRFDPKEGMDFEVSQRLRDEFPDTAGNIAIGIRDDHIRAMLASDLIDYVIPYHRSSMDKATRAKIGLKNWSEYESQQTEKPRDYDNTVHDENYHKHTSFSEWYSYSEAKALADQYKAQGMSTFEASKAAMEDMGRKYIELCHSRGLQEKFVNFSGDEGYWKLLIDRKMINQVTGELIKQKAVRPVFDEDAIADILNNEVQRVRETQPDMDYAVDEMVRLWESGDIQKAARSKVVQQQVKAIEDHFTQAMIVNSSEELDNGGKYSLPANEDEAPETQAISSWKTSIKQIPALFKTKGVIFGDTNIDIGGGRFDLATDYLRSIGTTNMVFDPYNRSEEVNRATLDYLRSGNKADTATCANVLNVIAEEGARANVILETAKAIKPDGKAYFMVYEGDGSGVGRETSSGWQNNRKTADYVDEISKYFDNVQRNGKLITATNPKANLPEARWEVQPGNAIKYSMSSRSANARLRNKIKDTEYKLRRMIERPDDKHFIPKQYMQDALDFVEAVMDADKAKRARGTLKWMRAVRQIKADTSNYTVAHTFPDGFVDLMQEAADLLNSKEINRMDADELVFVENVITEMYHRIRKAASMFKREKNASAYEEGKNAVETINKRKPYSNSGLARLAHNLVTDHLSPEREFNKLAGYEKDNAIARSSEEFADGSRVANKTKMDMTEYFEPLMTGENKKNFEKFTGKKAELIDTGIKSKKGGNIKITQDFRAALWLHSLNQDNLRGMRNGLTMPDLKLWQQGKFKAAWNQGERLKLSEEDLNRILSGVTEYEKQWAKAWQDMQAYSTPLLNEVALELNGWRKFNVENYFPIRRDGNYLATDFESLTMDARLANAGWTKARKHATNPMMFEPLTTVVNRTINGSSQYIGLAIPIENFNRMFNATMPGYEDSPKAAIRRVFGEKEYEYIERLLTDLNTGGRTVDPSFMDRLRSKAAGSALGANPTVVIKQAASYPTAAAELGWSALSRALTSTRKFDEKVVKKYTSAYWERTADNIQAMNANVQANTLQKSSGFLSGAIAAMDRATVRKIWIACEYATEAENKALQRGTDEYYQEVARKFEHVLERTQPEYGVWQRPHVLRSNNPLVKGVSMYKTQAMQNWNILYDAVADFSAQARRYKADKSAKNKAEVDRARTTLARAVSSQVVSAAVLAIMTAVGKGLLHKPEPYQDDKGEITPESVSYQLGKDAISSLAGMMVGGSELFELITGIAEGKQPYDIEASQISMVNDLYQAIYKMGSAVTAIGNSNLSTEQKQEKGKKAVETFLQSVGAIYGVPVRNLENVAKSVYQYTTDIISGKTFQEMMTGDVSMTAGARHMGEALANGDTETYTRLYNRLLQQGKSTSQINSALKSWLKSNDQRIRQAAEAIDSGDLNTYNRLINEMVDDGYGMANVVTSIEAVRKDMVKGDTEEVATEYTPMTYDDIIKAQNNEQTDEYTYSQLNQLLENGNTQAARKLQSELFKSKGTTKVKSALTSYWKPKYREAYQSRNRAELNRIVRLLKTMGYSDATINKWKEVDSTTSNSKKKTGFGSSSFGSAFGKSNKKKSTSKFGGR